VRQFALFIEGDRQTWYFQGMNQEIPMNESCKLSEKHCIPCKGGVPPLKAEEIRRLSSQLEKGWTVVNNHHLEREYTFPDFQTALDFTNHIGRIAEEEAHHPDIALSWGRVKITLWTHKIDGLSESDFILAAKCDKLNK